MVQIKKSHLYFLDLVVSGFLLVLGISYYVVSQRMNIQGDLTMKYEAENILYLTIIFTLAVNLFCLYLFRKSKKLLKDIDKLIELSKYGRYDIKDFMKRWGRLGEKINLLIFQLHELNGLQALKISSLAGIINFLLEHTKVTVAVLDRQGKIVNCSAPLPGRFEVPKETLVNRNIAEIIPGVNFENILLELERNSTPLSQPKMTMEFKEQAYEATLIFFPILTTASQIVSVVVAMEDEHLVLPADLSPSTPTPAEPKNDGSRTGLLEFFQKKFEKLVPKKGKS